MYRIKSRGKTRANHSKRFALLANLGLELFNTRDLANLWQITNRNTLYTTLKRYSQQGLINRIYKGLYSLKPLNDLDPYKLGLKALSGYAYVSTETALARHGVILQDMAFITLVGSRARKFKIGEREYLSRRLPDKFLYNPTGVVEDQGVKWATSERAAADLLYFNPRAYFDNQRAIDWPNVKKLQREIGYKLVSLNATTNSKRLATNN